MCHSHKKNMSCQAYSLNQTLTTFENAMFLSFLRLARWFFPKSSISPLPTGWHRFKMSEMVLWYLYEKVFITWLLISTSNTINIF